MTGRTTDVRTSIDSVSYSLSDDLQATTGVLADALRNVPSVDVDPEGNVSLRGDANVTILVDGRPSGLLSGAGRAQAILTLPADRYARIAVMTNPSAAYTPEGSGGVINLITKPTAPRPGRESNGSVRVNVGTDERWNAAVSGSVKLDRLTLSGDANFRTDPLTIDSERVREQFDPATGALVSTLTANQRAESVGQGGFARLNAEYRLTDRTALTSEVRVNVFERDGRTDTLTETSNPAGTVVGAFERDSFPTFNSDYLGFTNRVLHQFDDAGHEWSNEVRYDRNSGTSGDVAVTRFVTPAAPDLYEELSQASSNPVLTLTSAYVRPFAEGGQLRLGYELNSQEADQTFIFTRGPSEAGLVVVPALSNSFEAEQQVHALYTTWERPLTETFSAQLGLRLEQVDIEVRDLTGGLEASQDYFKVYPTAHLQYTLSDAQTLRASYSRRIQRPQLGQLNPFVFFIDPQNRSSGNPDLAPQETDAFEVMWQLRQGQTFYMATAYLRDTSGAFTPVARDIGGGVVLTRLENLGGRRDTGVELTANGPLTSTLRYNAAINVLRQEIDSTGIPGGGRREKTFANGRLTLSWQPTPADFLQISGVWPGQQLLAQGSRESGSLLNIGYRRKLTDQVSFIATGVDILNNSSSRQAFETSTFRETLNQDIKVRAFFIGLSWTLGSGQNRQQEQFDF